MRMTKQELNFAYFCAIADPDFFYWLYCPELHEKAYYFRRKQNKFFKRYCKKKKVKYLGNGKFLKI